MRTRSSTRHHLVVVKQRQPPNNAARDLSNTKPRKADTHPQKILQWRRLGLRATMIIGWRGASVALGPKQARSRGGGIRVDAGGEVGALKLSASPFSFSIEK